MKSKKVLVTGGEGFLGTYLNDCLSHIGGQEITIFDKISSSRIGHFRGDILSKEDVQTVFAKRGPFRTVYHLAGAMPSKAVSDDITWRTNVSGTINVASEAVRSGAESFVFTSSNVTYGIPDSLPITEETPLRPLEVYGKSKAQAERELERFKKRINIQIFRCPVITGVGRLGLQAILFEFISENRNVYVLGDGGNTYQFVDAMDVSVALELASHQKGFDIYTIGGDGVIPLRDIYQKVIDEAQSGSKIVSLPKAPALAILSLLNKLNISPLGIYQYTMIGRSLYADTTKIKKKLGWKPQKTNVDSFVENYRWYEANKQNFTEVGSSELSENRSLPRMKVFKLLKFLS